MLKKTALCLQVLLFACAAFGAQIDICHTSDAHGYYYPRIIDGKTIGGYAALAGFMKQNQNCLLLDSGDFLAGTYEARQTKGRLSVELMKMLGYSAATVGNHEGDFGQQAMLDNFKAARFDLLAANMSVSGADWQPAPYKIYNTQGKKIAVIGIARNPLPASAQIKTGRDITSLKRALAEVKKQNPDAIVLLAHASAADDLEEKARKFTAAVANMKGIDLMLGGHVHKIIQNKKINNTVFIESGAELKGLSKIILTFDDKTGKLIDIKSQYIALDAARYQQDEAVKKYAEKFYNKELDAPIARANETIYKYNPGADTDSQLGNLIADIIRQRTGADIALHNTEGLRGDISKGQITQRLVFDVLPFPDKIVLVKVSGSFIATLARQAIKSEGRSAFQYSGLNFTYAYRGGKAEIVEIFANNAPLDYAKTYALALTDFNAAGGAEGFMFKNLPDKKVFGDITLQEIFADYLKANPGGINAPPDGRIKKI